MDGEEWSRRGLLAAAGSGLAASLAGCTLDPPGGRSDSTDATTEPPNEPPLESPVDFDELPAESELTELYRAVVDSVAAIRVQDEFGAGGGTAWAYADSYFVTNEHVARLSEQPYCWFRDVGWREASIVGMDVHSDLAVLEVHDPPAAATPLKLVDTPAPVGTPVAAIGNPFHLTGSFTTGIISGRNRTIDLPDRRFSIADGVQTDAAVNPGNSGGPLVTFDGEVAGVITAGQGQTIGFAVSAELTKRVVPELIENGEYEHTYLGVWLRDVTPGILEANDLGGVTWGVYIHEVMDDSPSDGSLQGSTGTDVVNGQETPVGGDVIVDIDGTAIMNREHLSSFLALETEPGQNIRIELIRDGERQEVDVTLEARPDADESL